MLALYLFERGREEWSEGDYTCQRRRFEELNRGGNMCADERRCKQPEWGNKESKLFVLSQVDMVTQQQLHYRKLNEN